MRQLFLFIYKYRSFFVFLVFEGLSGFLVIQNHNYQQVAFLNSSNVLVGNVVSTTTDITDYFGLRDQNNELSEQVARLHEQISFLQSHLELYGLDSTTHQSSQYSIIPAKVVNNSYRYNNNYITLNKGWEDGIAKDQGVIGPRGIVGKIRSTSRKFAIVVSLLHTDLMVSSLLKRSGDLCTTNWDGRDPGKANLLYVSRHVYLTKGDSVVTSGYNSVFPDGQLVGIVDEVLTGQNATFHDITIRLATDFPSLNYVSVVLNKSAPEKDSLEMNREILN
ncbi:MAG: rod shape-determining protein MreC [Bacteroidetes bacterium]|nr:rod shape-determining protein MreC [Bacteroidota bacterium]MDA1119247.1 rod shape-determining protein MreC [Bacteroidota bacterium]